jgi:hypothetical protein
MRKLVVMSFPDAWTAFHGFYALLDLHRERRVFVFGAAVVERSEDGTLSVQHRSEAPGLLLESLVVGYRTELLEQVEQKLASGGLAVIAEVLELVTSLDARMEAVGGTPVFSWWWNEYGDDVVDELTRRRALDAGGAGRRAPRRSGWPQC